MPIQIIVVFFIVLVVGGAILGFSKNTLNRAQQDLNEWRTDPAKKDLVVEVTEANETTILSLANACVSENVGNVDEKVCFALFADSFTIADWSAMNDTALESSFRLDTDGVSGTPTAVRITYNPTGRIIVS